MNGPLVQRIPKRSYADGTTGAIAFTLSPNTKWQLLEVCLHLSAAGGAGNLTITKDSGIDAKYDVNFKTQDMTAIQDLDYIPEYPHTFFEGDVLKIDWPNAGNKTYGLEVIYTELI